MRRALATPDRHRRTSAVAAAVAALALAFPASGCVDERIVDDISTEVTVTDPGPPGSAIEVRKRFRFTHDPTEARGVYFDRGSLQILIPPDRDLSLIHRIEIYGVHPNDGDVLLAVGDGFVPGQRTADLEVVYTDDLRGFATDDSRIMFSFLVVSGAWGRPFPAEGVTVIARAAIVIEI